MRLAMSYGAKVKAFDPVANENARKELGANFEIVDDMYEAIEGADGLIVSTDWDEFKSPDFARVSKLMRQHVLFDGRNLYRPSQMQQAGFSHYSVGRAPVVSC